MINVLSHRGPADWKDLIRETQALYGVSEVEAKTRPLPDYDF